MADRDICIDKDKAGEMILVVNKMTRASEGNTYEQQEIIIDDLRQVLAPYTPEQLNLCFLDAESYLDSLKERETDPEYADDLLERSGYFTFIQTLDRFVEEKVFLQRLQQYCILSLKSMPAVFIDCFATFDCIYLADITFVSGTVKNTSVQLFFIHSESLLSNMIWTS